MNRLLAPLCCAVLTVLLCAECPADVLSVIPENALVAVVARNADAAEEHLREMVRLINDEDPNIDAVEQLLIQSRLRTRERRPDDPGDMVVNTNEFIDRKAPLAFVVVQPAFDLGMPLALVVKVTDYRKFLGAVAAVQNAVAAEVTEEGTDMIRGGRRTTYAADLGQYAVVANAEYVVKTFKAEINKNLAASNPAGIREAVEKKDLAAYVNMDLVLKTFGPNIKQFKESITRQMKRNAEAPGGAQDKTAKILVAEIDMLMDVMAQVDAICASADTGAAGAALDLLYQPLSDTMLSRVAAKMKPARLQLLDRMNGPFVALSAANIDAEAMREMTAVLEKFMTDSGLAEAAEGGDAAGAWKRLMEAGTGESASVWVSPAPGDKGVVRLISVTETRAGADMRKDMEAYIRQSVKSAVAMGGPVRASVDFAENVETYRGAAVSRLDVTFERNPEAPEPMNPAQDPLRMVEAIYGPKVTAFMTRTNDKMVTSLGYPDTAELRAQVDRLLDGARGNLAASAAYQNGMKDLPQDAYMMMMFSPAEMIRTVVARIMLATDQIKQAPEVVLATPSAATVVAVPDARGLLLRVRVPMQEMQNALEAGKAVGAEAAKRRQERRNEQQNAPPPPL